jgi:hypothetical protein
MACSTWMPTIGRAGTDPRSQDADRDNARPVTSDRSRQIDTGMYVLPSQSTWGRTSHGPQAVTKVANNAARQQDKMATSRILPRPPRCNRARRPGCRSLSATRRVSLSAESASATRSGPAPARPMAILARTSTPIRGRDDNLLDPRPEEVVLLRDLLERQLAALPERLDQRRGLCPGSCTAAPTATPAHQAYDRRLEPQTHRLGRPIPERPMGRPSISGGESRWEIDYAGFPRFAGDDDPRTSHRMGWR